VTLQSVPITPHRSGSRHKKAARLTEWPCAAARLLRFAAVDLQDISGIVGLAELVPPPSLFTFARNWGGL
jgi:hypothetical protein